MYNLVRVGDSVTGTTWRKISKDAVKGSDSESVKMKLTVCVEGIEYDGEGGRSPTTFILECTPFSLQHHYLQLVDCFLYITPY